jgi:uncharacterized protein YdhG (YjbR/CyaY superfamily)
MAGRPRTIDEYLAPLSKDKRDALQKLRQTIRSVAPLAEECISYSLPAFRLGGKMLVAMGARANHCAFYPMSASTVAAYKSELRKYVTSMGTIRFQPRPPARGLGEEAGQGADRGERGEGGLRTGESGSFQDRREPEPGKPRIRPAPLRAPPEGLLARSAPRHEAEVARKTPIWTARLAHLMTCSRHRAERVADFRLGAGVYASKR